MSTLALLLMGPAVVMSFFTHNRTYGVRSRNVLVNSTSLPTGTKWELLAWSEGKDDTSDAKMVDIDLFDQHDKIKGLKDEGKTVICYYSAGTAEDWRPDVKKNKDEWNKLVVGQMAHWSEAWLDITQFDLLTKLMGDRLKLAKQYGCDGVEPDNTDCASNGDDCWKKIKGCSHEDAVKAQIKYNKWTAETAHSMGMLAGLKNSGDFVSDLVDDYDFSIVEQCVQYKECDTYQAFEQQNKAIFGIEYHPIGSSDCQYASKNGITMKYCDGNGEECNEGNTIHNCH